MGCWKSPLARGIPIIESFTVGTGRDLSLQNHRTLNEGSFKTPQGGVFDATEKGVIVLPILRYGVYAPAQDEVEKVALEDEYLTRLMNEQLTRMGL